MRFLVDNSVSWRVGRELRARGHDVVHVANIGLEQADDASIYRTAVTDLRVILTQDSDFGPIHASSQSRIAVILIRLSSGKPGVQADVLIQNIVAISDLAVTRSFVTIEDDRITVQGSDTTLSE